MSSKSPKTPKISQFFSPTREIGEMEGTKQKKRAAEVSKSKPAKKSKKEEKKKGRRSKKPQPGDGPIIKRASSAYIHFTKDFRLDLKKKHTGTLPKANEIAKMAGEAWKKLTEEEKKPYQVLAEADRQRYLIASGKNIPAKDPDKPKRPSTAYFLFLAVFRKEMAGKPLEDGKKIPSLAGERWRGMGDKEKEPYAIQEAAERKKYEKAMEEYRAKQPAPEKKAAKPKPKPKPKPESEEEDDDEDDDEEEEDEDDDEEASDDEDEDDD